MTARAHFLDQHIARRFDGHAGQHGARRVLDDARDGRLGERGDRQQDRTCDDDHSCESTHNPTSLFRAVFVSVPMGDRAKRARWYSTPAIENWELAIENSSIPDSEFLIPNS